MDYHERQPYAVMIGVLFLPFDSCDDANEAAKNEESGVSSFGAAVKYFRNRITRATPHDVPDMFERFFIGLYEADGATRGTVAFYDVARPKPPRNRRPKNAEVMGFSAVIDEIRRTYDERNNPPFGWA